MESQFTSNAFEAAKNFDLVDYLFSLGYQPVKIRNNDHWYLSPLRSENDPSFKVNRTKNVWYDHGLGKGGNIIDFGVLYYNCTPIDLIEKLAIDGIAKVTKNELAIKEEKESKIKVTESFPLRSISLLKYLQQRKIPIDLAREFCSELHYVIGDKKYYGIGFKNDLGGYEIRNPYYKSSSSPKGISTINNKAETVAVFEGFIDFLSFMSLAKIDAKNQSDYLILNSVSFFQKARSYMENHRQIRLFLDRDQTGLSYTKMAISLSKKYSDASLFYKNHKDLNDWLVNTPNGNKKHVRRKM